MCKQKSNLNYKFKLKQIIIYYLWFTIKILRNIIDVTLLITWAKNITLKNIILKNQQGP